MNNFLKRGFVLMGVLSIVALVAMSGMVDQGNAAVSSGGEIISAPASVANDASQNSHQQAFDEAQGVTLASDLAVDGGTIPAGTTVDSHMIFLDPVSHASMTDANVEWIFDGPILGVMSDAGGTLEAASSGILGATGTTYPGAFSARGMEGGDSYSVAGNQITVTMTASEPGDWIRVVTADTPPVAVDDYYSMYQDTTLSVGVPGVLGNDYDTDGDPIVIHHLNPATSGTVVLFNDGHFHYTPYAGFAGVASFHYYISYPSGEVMDDAYAYITVLPAIVDVDIDIDIKPCSDPNSVNLKSKGVLPVAILGTGAFDVTDVDLQTVELDGVSPIRYSFEDVCPEDGYLDLILHFSVPTLADASWDEDTTEATLTGETYGGTPIVGTDSVRIVPRGPKD